jgi:hypothetical protein
MRNSLHNGAMSLTQGQRQSGRTSTMIRKALTYAAAHPEHRVTLVFSLISEANRWQSWIRGSVNKGQTSVSCVNVGLLVGAPSANLGVLFVDHDVWLHTNRRGELDILMNQLDYSWRKYQYD